MPEPANRDLMEANGPQLWCLVEFLENKNVEPTFAKDG
jgi:hypothetical protein